MSQLTTACNKNDICITTPVVVVVGSGVVVDVVVVSVFTKSKQTTNVNRRGEKNTMMHCHSWMFKQLPFL